MGPNYIKALPNEIPCFLYFHLLVFVILSTGFLVGRALKHLYSLSLDKLIFRGLFRFKMLKLFLESKKPPV